MAKLFIWETMLFPIAVCSALWRDFWALPTPMGGLGLTLPTILHAASVSELMPAAPDDHKQSHNCSTGNWCIDPTWQGKAKELKRWETKQFKLFSLLFVGTKEKWELGENETDLGKIFFRHEWETFLLRNDSSLSRELLSRDYQESKFSLFPDGSLGTGALNYKPSRI